MVRGSHWTAAAVWAVLSLSWVGCNSPASPPDSGRAGPDTGTGGVCHGEVAVASYPYPDYFTGARRDATCTAASFTVQGPYGDIHVEGGPTSCGTAYLVRDLGTPLAAPYRASVRLAVGASESPAAPFTALQVLDGSGTVVFRVWVDTGRDLHFSSAAGALDTSAIDVDLAVTLPNDGTSAVPVQVDLDAAGMLTVTADSSVMLSQHIGLANAVQSFQVGVMGFLPARTESLDLLESDASLAPMGLDGGMGAPDGGIDGGPPGGTRTVTNPQVLFDGTELDLNSQYWQYIEDPGGSVVVADDPLGVLGSVLRFREQKEHSGWQHVMVAAQDKRDGYNSFAQISTYGPVYHTIQKVFLRGDPQYMQETSMGVFDIDYHCEPCQANNLGIGMGNNGAGSICLTINYSTDSTFDPRGPTRGGTVNPWVTINANSFVVPVAADGTPDLPSPLPPTGSVSLCRSDLSVSDVSDRWVDIELLVRPSSYDTGVIRLWIDGKPFFYEGPNDFRWNELGSSSSATPVSAFQWGIYMPSFTPASGTPTYWELFTTPPHIEIGDDIVYSP